MTWIKICGITNAADAERAIDLGELDLLAYINLKRDLPDFNSHFPPPGEYLRQGLGRHFVATAEPTRLGGRIGSTQMRLVNDEGTLIATAAAAYVVA